MSVAYVELTWEACKKFKAELYYVYETFFELVIIDLIFRLL